MSTHLALAATDADRAATQLLELPSGHPALRTSPADMCEALELLETVRNRQDSATKWKSAVHEGGHAAASLSLGVRVIRMSLEDDHALNSAGSCTLEWGDERRSGTYIATVRARLQLEAELLVQLSAGIAQEFAGCEFDPEHMEWHDRRASQAVRRFLPPLSEEEIRAFLAWVRAHARARMSQLYPVVVDLAVALYEHRTLEEPAILDIAARHLLRPWPAFSLPSPEWSPT